MLITEVINQSENEADIYFLLSAYLRGAPFFDELGCLSEYASRLPLTRMDDATTLFEKLQQESKTKAARADEKNSAMIDEALRILNAGLTRLETLQKRQVHAPTPISCKAA